MIPFDELEKLAKAATRKWFRAGRPDMQSYDAGTGRPFKNLYNDDIAGTSEAARVEGENSINDTQYIAALSPDVVLELIAEVRRLRADRIRQVGLKVIDEHDLRAQLADAIKTMEFVQSMCGNPSAADGCRHILSVTRRYLEKYPK